MTPNQTTTAAAIAVVALLVVAGCGRRADEVVERAPLIEESCEQDAGGCFSVVTTRVEAEQ